MGIDKIAAEYLVYGPVYWGFNDMDYLTPYSADEKMMEELEPASNGPPTHMNPRIRSNSWTPEPPLGSSAPSDRKPLPPNRFSPPPLGGSVSLDRLAGKDSGLSIPSTINELESIKEG